ncbi:hypothetical protein BDV96DRAFT_640289 [Lophiotrema nucula]|uniref:Uncharacterized protein n=1 Tax=Lophiotrema nucula TaxID=690887 RepID=A0A6A5ZTN9_9PLEO|nr:hypothetical protein BDV96DRAFT_640289 [Lophiotrema nucula]
MFSNATPPPHPRFLRYLFHDDIRNMSDCNVSPLLALPRELRNIIYKHIANPARSNHDMDGVLLSCWKLRNEFCEEYHSAHARILKDLEGCEPFLSLGLEIHLDPPRMSDYKNRLHIYVPEEEKKSTSGLSEAVSVLMRRLPEFTLYKLQLQISDGVSDGRFEEIPPLIRYGPLRLALSALRWNGIEDNWLVGWDNTDNWLSEWYDDFIFWRKVH